MIDLLYSNYISNSLFPGQHNIIKRYIHTSYLSGTNMLLLQPPIRQKPSNKSKNPLVKNIKNLLINRPSPTQNPPLARCTYKYTTTKTNPITEP